MALQLEHPSALSGTSRRGFLKVGAAAGGGLVASFALPGLALAADAPKPPPGPVPAEAAVGQASKQASQESAGFAPNGFIRIDRQGTVSLVMHKVEMGQGTFTSLPMLIAEELEVDLDKVKLVQAPPDGERYSDPLLGGQVTGGSTSIRSAYVPLRTAGATVRTMLVSAAAQTWGVAEAGCTARDGVVTHAASGRRLGYGQLVDKAATLPVPTKVALKDAKDFRLIGKRRHRLDSVAKTDGSAVFGIDVKVPNMRIATVAASPVIGGRLATTDDAKAMAVRGVRQIVRTEGAVAVVGDHMWAAKQGLAALAPTWSDGPNGGVTSAELVRQLAAASAAGPGVVARNDGDAPATVAASANRVEATYQLPFLAHAPMEPINITVDLRKDGCEIWCGTQVPTFAQGAAAKVAGLPLEKVVVHNQLIGGGFGRRLEVDSVVQAVQLAKSIDGPVKFVWSREEDIQHDYYRPYYYDRLSAALDANGQPTAWTHRVTGSSVLARFAPPAVVNGLDSDAVEGAKDMPYAVPNVRVDYVRQEPPGVPTAFWRGVGPTHNIFVVESFVDELAAKAGKDPLQYRLGLMTQAPRQKAVLEAAAKQVGWGTPMKPVAGSRVGRGLSSQFAFGSYLAQAVEVAVDSKSGEVRVLRVVCAVDCGQVVEPGTVEAQVQGGVIFGISAALWGEITFDRGRVMQSNFHDYRVVRMNEAPIVEVIVIPSREAPGGLGEPGTSALAPALANAVFAATGQRIRKLPIGTAAGVKDA